MKEPNCKENREAAEKIKRFHGTVRARSEIWDGAEAQPRMLLLPQGMKSQHRMEKEEGPEDRGKFTPLMAPGMGSQDLWLLQVLGKSQGCCSHICVV